MSETKHTPGPWEAFKINNPKDNPEIWAKYEQIAVVTHRSPTPA